MLCCLFSQLTLRREDSVAPILEIGILRHGDLDCFAQGLKSSKWRSQGLDLGSLAAQPEM